MHILKKLHNTDEKWQEVPVRENRARILCLPSTILGIGRGDCRMATVVFSGPQGYIRSIKVGEDLSCFYSQLAILAPHFVRVEFFPKY